MFDISYAINSANDEDCVVLPAIENTEHLVNVINDVAQYNQGIVVIGIDNTRCQAYGVDEVHFKDQYKVAQRHLAQVETRLSFIDYRFYFKLAVIHVKKEASVGHEYTGLRDVSTNIKRTREARQ
ncbi:hypothetical protein [Serratia aquatilis]|uniref:Schlafen AlbA-2 domain-containing protein n=1 Tax=Serratia aquatilis TaxID=1737515 RepID=A0ABV6EF54_9GAMM